MYIQQIINGLCCKVVGCDNPNISSLSCDTSTVKAGCLFFCLKGQKYDGHNFFRKAIGDGAVAIVTEKPLPTKVLQIIVDDCRSAMSLCAKNFYDNCADKLKLVAVVGTNGKTSTSHILYQILQKNNVNCALIGTNGVYFNGQHLDCLLTTPDPILLHSLFKQMYQNNVQVVIMEVSAHAIALNKIEGLHFEVGIFTNFSQDHLDFFGSMSKYGKVKKSFFNEQTVTNAIVNIDDELGREIYNQMPSVCYAIDDVADCSAKDITLGENFTLVTLQIFAEKIKVKSKLVGKFNVYNLLGAVACASILGICTEGISDAVDTIGCVEGRNQTLIRRDGVRIVIDFAHTPDGVKNILQYLKDTTKGQLIVVFGCGGNRDKFKRPLMGKIVSELADYVVITNDNPRYEDPRLIAEDVLSQVKCQCKVQLNRSQATAHALAIAKSGDTVAILGKGAEKYQEIKGKKYPYCDLDVVTKLLEN